MQPPDQPKQIYTIGYGARNLDELLSVLKSNSIRILIDIRSKPYSNYKPEFSRSSLKNYLQFRGIQYVFMGDTLGGQPDNHDCYTNGKVDYEKVSIQLFFNNGIEQLKNHLMEGEKIVLMCSEGKPENCHRSKLIGKQLKGKGMEVLHIDENDDVISQEEVILRITGGQLTLFGDDSLTFTSRKKYMNNPESSE